MTDPAPYTPPPVWTWNHANGGRFAKINRPTAGATHDHELPVGRHPLQLYSLATPNGVKVTVLLEELLALGHGGAEYDAWLVRINEGEQFGSGFVAANPNSKIPVLVDRSDATPIRPCRASPDSQATAISTSSGAAPRKSAAIASRLASRLDVPAARSEAATRSASSVAIGAF